MRILLVEDDAEVARFVKKGLQEAGHTVEHATNGRDGLFLAASEQFDLMVLDRMLPGGVDGVRLVETLRSQGNRAPVLFLSALTAVDERVKGLKAGGDDYLTKPFAFAELLARVEALGRRPSVDAPSTKLKVADLELDLLSRTVTRAGKRIDVQPREFRLLEHLMRHAGPGGDADHAAGEGLGLPLRPADQRHRRPRLAPAAEGGPRLRGGR